MRNIWVILAQGCSNTDMTVQQGPYNNDWGPIFHSKARTSKVIHSLLHGTQTINLFILILPAFTNEDTDTWLILSLWKGSIWQKTNQVTTNQKAQIYLWNVFPYNNIMIIKRYYPSTISRIFSSQTDSSSS